MAQEDKKPLHTLYESLKADNYDVPDTYELFERTLTASGKEGVTNRMTLYNSLKSDNYDVPDTYESFANTLFAPVKHSDVAPVQTASVQPQSQPKQQTAQPQADAWRPSPMQQAALRMQIDSGNARLRQQGEQFKQRTENIMKGNKSGKPRRG